ncbi:hypothetical protein [Pontimicrobium sp. SW4]|uniref:DUF3299 domain-containing protein n=1 Tax=Pontimicrobium sp. SW4 TaxID=3153519 RepID=A0AAU7BU16_9FLAO
MKNRTVLFLFLLVLLPKNTFGQKKITWKNMLDVYANEFRLTEKNPTSTINEKAMTMGDIENKRITIVGYFLDLDPDGEWFVLSKNPFATCFFCGKAGPETVLELLGFKNEKKKFKSDDTVEVTGVFNPIYDLEGKLNFVLENVSIKHTNK